MPRRNPLSALFASVWNGIIDAVGFGLGCLAAGLVRRNWLYFPFLSETLSLAPLSLGWKLRRSVYRRVLPEMGKSAVIHFGTVIEDSRTRIGEDVWISAGCYLDYCHIGASVLIGPRAVLLSGGHHHFFERIDLPIKHQGNPEKRPLEIGEGAWIGANTTIMANVGRHAIVGAGAVVTRDVAPYTIVAGNPARVLRNRAT